MDGVRVNAVGPGVVETPLTAPIKNNPEWYNAYAEKEPDAALGAAVRNGGADALPDFRCRELRDRHGHLRRWRLVGR